MSLAELAFEQLIKYAKIGIGGRDSVILATMKAVGAKRIASHDEVFKKIEGLRGYRPYPKGIKGDDNPLFDAQKQHTSSQPNQVPEDRIQKPAPRMQTLKNSEHI